VRIKKDKYQKDWEKEKESRKFQRPIWIWTKT